MAAGDIYVTVPDPPSATAIAQGVAALIASRTVTIVSPLNRGGRLDVVRGDSYLELDGRALRFERGAEEQWPELDGWTLSLIAGGIEVPARTDGPDAVLVEVTAAESASFPASPGRYALVAERGESRVTLRQGPLVTSEVIS